MTYNYRAFGLDFVSEIKIFEFLEINEREVSPLKDFDEPVIEVRERLVENIIDPKHDFGWVRANDDRCVFNLEGRCRFEVRRDAITAHRLAEISDRELSYYLVSCALPAIANMRKMIPLHVSMVDLDGEVWMFLGASGAGKSTAAAALAANGRGQLLCDDLAILVSRDGVQEFRFGIRSIKLWRDAVDALGMHDADKAVDPVRSDKFHVSWAGPESVPLSKVQGLVYLNWGPSRRCVPLNPIERYVGLTKSIQGPKLMKTFNNEFAVHSTLSSLAESVGGYGLLRAKQEMLDRKEMQLQLENLIKTQ